VPTTIRVGEPIIVDTRSPREPDRVAVFEDDGATGYLYAAQGSEDDLEILDALHVYTAEHVTDADRDHELQLVWNEEGSAVALVLDNWAHAMVDYARPLAMCIDDFPPPDGFVTSHAWDEDAFHAVFPSLHSEWEWRSFAEFGREAIAADAVWTVVDDAGIPTPEGGGGRRTMPFWSSAARAERVIANLEAFAGMRPRRVPLERFERALTGMESDRLLVGINWSEHRGRGYDVEPRDVRDLLAGARS